MPWGQLLELRPTCEDVERMTIPDTDRPPDLYSSGMMHSMRTILYAERSRDRNAPHRCSKNR